MDMEEKHMELELQKETVKKKIKTQSFLMGSDES